MRLLPIQIRSIIDKYKGQTWDQAKVGIIEDAVACGETIERILSFEEKIRRFLTNYRYNVKRPILGEYRAYF